MKITENRAQSEVLNSLHELYELAGYKNVGGKILENIYKVMVSRFPFLQTNHLRIAWEKWAAGEIAPDLKPFGEFSAFFVCRILGDFKAYLIGTGELSTEYDKARQFAVNSEIEASKEIEPVDWTQFLKDLAENGKELQPMMVPLLCYDYLVGKGKLAADDYLKFERDASAINAKYKKGGIMSIGQSLSGGSLDITAKKLAVINILEKYREQKSIPLQK